MNGSTKFWIVFLSSTYIWITIFTFTNVSENTLFIEILWGSYTILGLVFGIPTLIYLYFDDFNDWLDRIFK